jgi:DNA-directed RNA polymerase specialized sigma24 family protein
MDFAEFYRRSKDECLRTVLISVGDQDTAQEHVAEAFARACASWRKVSRHPAPAAWVVRTALNANISWWRRHRREISVPDPRQAAGPHESIWHESGTPPDRYVLDDRVTISDHGPDL